MEERSLSRPPKKKRPRHRQRLLWSGVSFSLVTFFVVVAALNTGTNLLYLISGGLGSFLILSILLSRWALRRLVVTREAPSAVHRGEPFFVTTRIENRKLLLPTFSLRIESAERPDDPLGYVFKIPPRKAAVMQIREVFDRRGVHTLPPLEYATSFPFGLVEASGRTRDAVEVVVYPRIHSVRASVVENLIGSGEHRKRLASEGDEFFSLRDYVPGDDMRHIAWRSSARLGSYVVREMESETTRTVTLFLDTRRDESFDFEERFEDAIELVASLAVAMLNRRYGVSLVTPETYVPEGEGTAHSIRILEALARVEPADPSVGLPAIPGGSAGRRKKGAAHIMVSPDPSQWGRQSQSNGMRVLSPKEVFRA